MAGDEDGLRAILDAAERRRKSVTHYAPEAGDLAERLDTRNLDVEFRPIPPGGPEPFLVVRDGGRFRGAMPVEALREYAVTRNRRGAVTEDPEARAIVTELLDDTVFSSLSKRQLLSTVREFEDRALRVGTGTLHTGFQSAAAFAPQRELYRALAAETALDVHVYVGGGKGAEPEPLDEPNATLHADPPEELGRYWFLVFDGGEDPEQGVALVAEQRPDGSFRGVWTYDPELVDRALSLLPAVEGER
ncbi:DICT sensory domain-containing protein [Halogeometricum luteum]|uniref:Histidine kinase n=1 Tax=Halogeometricum luteum TaxID=2950537 RepID=A0ABU2G5P3_9EURY|nr:DICT sensory domain-containing protein [Halogeometricum sp. S3BR5-2]MDS0296107.1 histidine kinase [Halogeometricum sp. S3BR5-2]